jgi:hypothetical protein
LVGGFKNAGQKWRPKETPEKVQVHDFPDDAIGKAIPYGVYDMARNEAWVSIGQDHDTPAFVVVRAHPAELHAGATAGGPGAGMSARLAGIRTENRHLPRRNHAAWRRAVLGVYTPLIPQVPDAHDARILPR